MKNYTDDPQLRSLRDVISDPKNKLNKIKFAKGALYKDSIHIHPTNDNIDKKIYFAFIRASKLLISSAYQRYICITTIKKAKQFNYLLCQTLVIALRPDGTYVIIDGQHKAIMAFLSGEDLDLPCQIFKHDVNSTLAQCIKIEAQLFQIGKLEVHTNVIGELVIQNLKAADRVSYIRYASVYRDFKDIETFQNEISELLEPTNEPEKKQGVQLDLIPQNS